MCLDCGCHQPDADHGDPRHLTLAGLTAAAGASGITVMQAVANILATLQFPAPAPAPDADVAKAGPELEHGQPGLVCKSEEKRFVLGIAYQAGPDPRIAKGVDGGRDFFTEDELEKAAWNFMLKGQQHGVYHIDGTEGAARPVESFIYRNPQPWVVADDLVVKQGDWCLGAILDPKAWDLYKSGRLNGWSPQGVARRRRVSR